MKCRLYESLRCHKSGLDSVCGGHGVHGQLLGCVFVVMDALSNSS
jgi:hypothetical protein